MNPTQPPPDNTVPGAVPERQHTEQPCTVLSIEHHPNYKDVIKAWKHYRADTDIKAYINPVIYYARIAHLCSEGTGVPIQDVKAIIHDFYGHDI